MRLCRCGAIVADRCSRCDPATNHAKTTAQRGYDHKWKMLSERKRAVDPLCEACEKAGRVRPAVHVHHIESITKSPHLRLVWSNLQSLCAECHSEIEAAKRCNRKNGRQKRL